MTIRRLRTNKTSQDTNSTSSERFSRQRNDTARSNTKRFAFRKSLIETLESRQLMAVGPRLIGVQPNNSDLIENGVIRTVAPTELTFRFDQVQVIDPASLSGIRVTRAGGDGSFGLPSVSTDFGSDGRVDIQLTARNAGDFLRIDVSTSNLGPGAGPQLSLNGSTASIVLNSASGSLITATNLVNAINSSPALSARLSARLNGGHAATALGGAAADRYGSIVMRTDNDVIVQPGAVIIGDRPNENEVTLRFAENLPDDVYRLEVFGFDDAGRGITGLRNLDGQLFQPSMSGTRQDTIEFRLDLGSRVTGVVPQPVVRSANGELTQLRDTIVVYFDDDKLFVENDANGNPTSASAENPEFYQLYFTANTVRNTDDDIFFPVSARYNASANTVTLRFNDDLDRLAGPSSNPSAFRLRVGTRESRPMEPVQSEAAATAIIDMNTDGAARVRFTARAIGSAGNGITVNFVNSNNPNGGEPTVTVNGSAITVDLVSSTTTVDQVIAALETSAAATLVRTTLEPGSQGNFVVGSRPINYRATLVGLGDTFDTSMNLGTIGSAAVPQTSLILRSELRAGVHRLDLPGGPDDISQRIVPEVFENHINPDFGADDFPGIRTLYYNFQDVYGTVLGSPVNNSISEKQKERIREALHLWTRHLGVQFVETANAGITFALGDLRAVPTAGFRQAGNTNFQVRIDPEYNRSLVVFSASNSWQNEYGESLTRSAAASIGFVLGLSYAGDLEPDTLMSMDPGFLNFPPGADRNFEPIFPGNQDVIHGQYLHRPEGSDVDFYRFDIDFGPNGENRTGVFVAETFAERSDLGSLLDTRLALYKQVQATAMSNLGAGQDIQVSFTAEQPGKLGNNLQIFVTRSPRGENELPLVQVFPNAIVVDLNSTVGSESTVQDFITALDNDIAARSLVKVRLESGAAATKIGGLNITYSPITLRGGRVDLIAQNDDYFSRDSLIRINLDSGVYFVGVSASGNDQYDPTIPNSGFGGRTQGHYDLRMTFRAQTDGVDTITDVAMNGDTRVPLDGNGDGLPGGVYDFWFETRQLDRSFRFTSGAVSGLEGQIITLTSADGIVRRFEFSQDLIVGTGNTRIPYSPTSSALDLAIATATAINSRTELNITASASGDRVTLRRERLLQVSPGLNQFVDVLGRTIFVDKSAGPNADGSLERPFNNISASGVPNAFGATFPGDIVRILPNGGIDGRMETLNDNLAYEIGFGLLAGTVLSDGASMDVPRGVNVMVEPGVIFKLNRARIGVGSSTLGVDRSGGVLQVLGAPILLDANGNAVLTPEGQRAAGSVYFTSWLDESIGLDNFSPTTTPRAGDWGGLVYRRDLDREAGRFDLEDEGIFLQYLNNADIRFGGSNAVVVDSVQRTVHSVEVYGFRPTITNNRITNSAGNAMLATQDSFRETLFSEPLYQRRGIFTPDYDRVGLNLRGNIMLNNSVNGLFVQIPTPLPGGEQRQLEVPVRFNDTDIVHVFSENLLVRGRPGASILDQTIPPTNFVSLQGTTGGSLIPGSYNYKITFVDRNGYETPPSEATQSVVVAAGQSAVRLFGLPGTSGEYVARRLYRSDVNGSGTYRLVAELDAASTSFLDRGQSPADVDASLLRDRPNVSAVGVTLATGASTLAIGTYNYRIVMVDSMGREGLVSNVTQSVTTNGTQRNITLNNLPAVPESYVARRIYRSAVGGAGTYVLVATVGPASSVYTDTGATIGTPLSIETFGNLRPTLSASVVFDPGMIVKLEGARIELGQTANFIAEGTVQNRVVFTSKLDDRFGAGGTFDTNNNGSNLASDASRGDWSGIYAAPGSKVSLDYGVLAHAGGVSRIEGTLKAFSPIELQQADARIAHFIFENNANGMGGQGPIDRLGRPANENYPFGNNNSRGSTLFIRGAQPIVVGNIFQNNSGTAITIDINSMDATIRGDLGRQTGAVDRYTTMDTNRGPLFRGNMLFNNAINGLEIRADATTNNLTENVLAVRDLQRNSLSTESVWDDTDIVHVLFDSVTVGNLQHSGGLRLQSSVNESLVIKMEGPGSNFDQERGTGFTATGSFGGVDNRVGGTIHVIGQPNFPVIFTSLRDDTVGAGLQPDGTPQTDTNNDGFATIPRPGDWRSLLFDTYSNDRNVRLVMEIESPNSVAPGVNDTVVTAQFLGALAPNASKSDENLPLGYVVHGVISEPGDKDVYSFTAEAGTEVWFDIDTNTSSLDTVIELLNGNGEVIARSTNSLEEQLDPSLILRTDLIDPFFVNPLIRRTTESVRRSASGILKDDGSTNEKDAGFRILLPGVAGSQSTYFVRVRSNGVNVDNPRAGLTSGAYMMQIRLQDMQEFAGSIVQFADIRYATNGIQANGLPSRSPFTGEAKVGMYDGTLFHLDNNTPFLTTTNVGSVHMTDLQAISVAGTLASSFAEHRIVFSVGIPTSGLVGAASGSATYPIVLDIDYADGLNRPDLQMTLLNAAGTQIAFSASSNVFDDQAGPLRGADLADLSRGSVGTGDPFIKTFLPRGTYTAVIRAQSAFTGSGAYQLEIRAGDSDPNLLRGAFGTSIQVPIGLEIPDKSVMEMTDGVNRIRFQFTYDGTFDFGNTPIPITATSTAPQIARALRDAINAMFTQNRWRISAANSNGVATGDAGTNRMLHLVGDVQFLSGADLLGAGAIIVSEGKGDVNVRRDQGQFVVANNTFSNVRDFAVWSAPADKHYADGRARQPVQGNTYVPPPTLGGAYARNLPVLNTVPFGVAAGSVAERAGVTPGMVVVNNLFDSAGLGGLHIQGEGPTWRITARPGLRDRIQNANAINDHSGSFINDGDQLFIDFQRQSVRFEFDDIAGAGTGAPAFGSGVVGGNGLNNADAIPIYYREDTGGQYMRPAGDLISGDASDDVIKQIHGSILGSPLVTNGTTQRLDAWIEPQANVIIVNPDDNSTWIYPTASLILRGPQAIVQSRGVFDIQRLGEYTAAPFVRAVNNTIIGNSGRASFHASTVDVEGNSTIAGATETWQGTGGNPKIYSMEGTLPADPLSTGSSDVDMFKFRLEIGHRVRVDVSSLTEGLDTTLRIFNSSGVAQNIGGSPEPTVIVGSVIDFTATVPGDYYLGISANGNNNYDPLSFADRARGNSHGSYRLNLEVIKPFSHVITVDGAGSYANGETFTITQVSDLPGQGTNTRTFEIVVGGPSATPPANGNIPVYIGPEYRTPDVARAIAAAINNSGMNNIQNLPNGFDNFGNPRLANPLAPVSAIAINGENGFSPTTALSQNTPVGQGNLDVGINSGAPRGAQLQAGLSRFIAGQNDFAPFDVTVTQGQSNGVTAATTTQQTGTHRGFGHDRTMSIAVLPLVNSPVTATGQGTTEKYVIVRNAYSIVWNNRRVEGGNTGNNINSLLPESGILVTGGASPTLMNNVFFNVQTPIVQERPSVTQTVTRVAQRPSAVVVAGNTYQYFDGAQPPARLGVAIEAAPTNVPNTGIDFNQTAGVTENLFVNVPGGNLLPSQRSRIIDSSIDSLPEREGFRTVKQAIGIAPSPILAPDRDLNGVLRADDPSIAPPNGLGGNIFKDRGAFERADFIGPTAIILNPKDNDAQGVDQDATESIIVLNSGVYPEFRIQLRDGFETANLGGGTGILDDSVVGRSGGNRMPGSAVTITENGRLLVEGIDYAFSYDSTTDQIVLRPLAGVWRNDRVYDISLNNRDRFVIDASTGDIVSDGDLFTIRDSSGGSVIFEYDSGYRLQIPQGIQLQIPLAGGGAGGIVDGDRFVVFDRGTSHVFEFDSNNNSIPGHLRIPFTSLSSRQNIAEAVRAALASIPALQPQILSSGDVFVGAVAGVTIDTTNTPAINQPNSTLALQVPELGTRPGGITDGQTFGVSDGRSSFVFEFDSDNAIAPGNVRIDISQATSPADVANAMILALDSIGLGISPTIVDQRNVHLSLTNAGRVDLISSNLALVGVSRAIADGQSITIVRTTSTGVTTRTFEFTTDATVTPGNIAVPISSSDSQEEIGVKLADAIQQAGLELEPRHVRDGNVFVGGSEEYSITVSQAPTVGLFGRPGVRGNSTLEIFGTLLMQLPARGGIDIPEDSTFTISANGRTVTFEFDSNFSGASLPNNVVINYNQTITAADLVTVMIPIIANAGLGLAPRDAGGGQIDLGLLPTSAVNPLGSGITLSRGNVLDGDFFTINNGTISVSFEFENLSVGNGRDPNRVPIRYNNQSSRLEVLQAMKAAIESTALGLTTEIQANGLKLLDNPRYNINIDNAPSLSLTGVPGGAIPVNFVQDESFSEEEMRNAIIRAINQANSEGKTSLSARVRGGSTFFVENAVTISPEVTSFYLRGIADKASNFLKSNRINGETQFTILMPGIELDYGDAPDPVTTTPGRYPTTLANDGARHVIIPGGLRLGELVTPDLDGRPTPLANGDQGDDGVSFQFQGLAMPLFNRHVSTSVTVQLSQPGFVDAWIDFNADGDWTDPGEHVLQNIEFTSTSLVQTFEIRVPSTFPVPATGLTSFARFRASTAGNHLPTGLALDGEVEDYLVRIIPGVPPIPTNDQYTMDEDQVGGLVTTDPDGTLTPGFVVDDGVLANDQRLDSRPLRARLVQFDGPGDLINFNSNGTFTYIPPPDFNGQVTLVYQPFIVIDELRGEIIESETLGTATITVRPVNDPPVANTFTMTTQKNLAKSLTQAEVIERSGAVPGPENESDQTLTITVPNNVTNQSGSVSVVSGVLTYIPAPGFVGSDTFVVTFTDNGRTGDLPDPRSVNRVVTVVVTDRNEPPVTTLKTIDINEDEVFEAGVDFFLEGDSPVELDQFLVFTGVEPISVNGGTVEFVGGRVIYTPRLNFNGTDTFFYFVTDSDPADPQTSRGTVLVNIAPVNDPPVRIGENMGTLTFQEDGPEQTLTMSVYFTDPDIETDGDVLTYSVSSSTNPTLLDINFVGETMFIRPRPDANGTALITVRATDREGLFATSQLTVVVTPVNDAPRLVTPLPDLNVNEDQIIDPIVLSPTYFFDPDVITNGDELRYEVQVSNPDLVTATVVNGALRLTLAPDASGFSTVTVTAIDLAGLSVSDTFDLVVAPVNDAPRSNPNSYFVPLGSVFVTTDARGNQTPSTNDNGVLWNDSDPEGDPFTAVLVTPPTRGTLTLNPDGTFIYRSNSAQATVGSVDTFQYRAVDSFGAQGAVTTVTLNIGNRLPSSHQNPTNRYDVNADGFVSPIDVLLIINFINENGGGGTSIANAPAPPPYRDVDGDEFIGPLDVLALITFINTESFRGGGEGEGDSADGDSVWVMPTMDIGRVPFSQMSTRDGANVPVALDSPVYGPLPLRKAVDAQTLSLADYLSNLDEDESAVALAYATEPVGDNESLDAYFADVFRE
ncbi:tandem-95 repeat protein [Pirellulaceae bacterium SH449]